MTRTIEDIMHPAYKASIEGREECGGQPGWWYSIRDKRGALHARCWHRGSKISTVAAARECCLALNTVQEKGGWTVPVKFSKKTEPMPTGPRHRKARDGYAAGTVLHSLTILQVLETARKAGKWRYLVAMRCCKVEVELEGKSIWNREWRLSHSPITCAWCSSHTNPIGHAKGAEA